MLPPPPATGLRNHKTLILGTNNLPLSFWPLPLWNGHQTVCGLVLGGITPVVQGRYWAQSPSQSILLPRVARLEHPIPECRAHMFNVQMSRQSVFIRDFGLCAYCGIETKMRSPYWQNKATIDHVIPRVQGGQNHWRNVVNSCAHCNTLKAGRTPEQWGHKPRVQPWVPRAKDLHALRLAWEARIGETIWSRWTAYYEVPPAPRAQLVIATLTV